MGEFVVVQITSAVADDGKWMDYSRTDAATAWRYWTRQEHVTQGKLRCKHWISGDVLSSAQLEVMAEDTSQYESKPPREWWLVTLTYEDGTEATGFTGVLYRMGDTVMRLSVLAGEGHGDLVSVHATAAGRNAV